MASPMLPLQTDSFNVRYLKQDKVNFAGVNIRYYHLTLLALTPNDQIGHFYSRNAAPLLFQSMCYNTSLYSHSSHECFVEIKCVYTNNHGSNVLNSLKILRWCKFLISYKCFLGSWHEVHFGWLQLWTELWGSYERLSPSSASPSLPGK